MIKQTQYPPLYCFHSFRKGIVMIKRLLCLFTAYVFAALTIFSVNADSQVDFSVKALIPDNQVNKSLSYFDLRMKPGQEQTLQVKVFNNDQEPIKVKVSVNAAGTGRNGLIVYSGNTPRDESLKPALSDIASLVHCEYRIPSGKSIHVPVLLRMPQERFDGVILGGIVVTKINEQSAETATSVQVKSDYQYAIGVQLSESDTSVKADLHLKYCKPALVNYHTALAVNLQNSEAAIATKLKITAKVYKHGIGRAYRTAEKEDISMAPNSNFDFCIDWQNRKFEPGLYRLHLTAQNEQGFWEWDEVFTITIQDADDVNDDAVDVPTAPFPWLIVLLLLTVILLSLVIFFLFFLRRKWRRRA